MPQPPFSDALAEGVREADPDALGAVWRALAPGLIRHLAVQLRDQALAEDLAGDTFVELVAACRTITGGPAAIRAWLYRAATRNLIDHRRRERRSPIQPGCPQPLPELDDDAPGPPERAEAAELAALTRALLAALTADQRQVLVLRFLADLPAAEVGALLGKPEGAVRALQHRAAAALRRSPDLAVLAAASG